MLTKGFFSYCYEIGNREPKITEFIRIIKNIEFFIILMNSLLIIKNTYRDKMTEIELHVELQVEPLVTLQVVPQVVPTNEAMVAPQVTPQVVPQVTPQVAPLNEQQLAVIEKLNRARENDEISTKYYNRLKTIFKELIKYENINLIAMEITEEVENIPWSSINATKTILEFSKLIINNPREFYNRICKMIEEDNSGIWNVYNKKLKNPTWVIYEMFRKIGLHPRKRGPQETDPGKSVMIYYKEWEFRNGDHFIKYTKTLKH